MQAIIKGCKIILNPAPAVAVPVPSDAMNTDETTASMGKKVKFSTVEETDEAAEGETPAAVDPAEQQRANIRELRARLLLSALEERQESNFI